MAGMFKSMIVKESLHIVRDRRTMLITLIMPLVLLLLFGFCHINRSQQCCVLAIVVDRHDAYTRDIVQRLCVNRLFLVRRHGCYAGWEGTLRRGEADAAIVLRDDNGQHESCDHRRRLQHCRR